MSKGGERLGFAPTAFAVLSREALSRSMPMMIMAAVSMTACMAPKLILSTKACGSVAIHDVIMSTVSNTTDRMFAMC